MVGLTVRPFLRTGSICSSISIFILQLFTLLNIVKICFTDILGLFTSWQSRQKRKKGGVLGGENTTDGETVVRERGK